MVSTRTGEADASKGRSDKARIPFMIDRIRSQPQAALCIMVDERDRGESWLWEVVRLVRAKERERERLGIGR